MKIAITFISAWIISGCFGGQVKDGVDGAPVQNAVVKVKNCPSCQQHETLTGPKGDWKFDSCNEPDDPLIMQDKVGAVEIEISKPGYVTQTIYHHVSYDQQDASGCYYDLLEAELFPAVPGNCLGFYHYDCDHDGLTNQQEQKVGTKYLAADSDCDGLDDAAEVLGADYIDYPNLGAEPARKSCLVPWQSEGHPDNYHYLGNYPRDRDRDYFDNLQGVAHDDNFWYFTQSAATWSHDAYLMKWPLSASLGSSHPAVRVNLEGMGLGDHPGDISIASYEDYDYLFIPIYETGGDDEMDIVVFRTDDLTRPWASSYFRGRRAAWCAIENNQMLYMNNMAVTTGKPITVWRINWDRLSAGQNTFLSFSHEFQVTRADGTDFGNSQLEWQQGGAISPNGRLFAMVHGGDGQSGYRGIKIFEISSGRLLNQSSQNDRPFRFQYETAHGDEPEGVTFWDLADRGMPNLSGQLHVIMIDNDNLTSDDLYFKHYNVSCGDRCKI